MSEAKSYKKQEVSEDYVTLPFEIVIFLKKNLL